MPNHTKTDVTLIVVSILFNLGLTVIALLWLFTIRFDDTKASLFGKDWLESPLAELSYFFFAGIIGGAAYCLRAVYQLLADAYTPRDGSPPSNPTTIMNIKVWFFWYLYRPFQGGVLAVILICLFNQGLIGIKELTAENIESIYFQVGIGFLVGFGTHEVTNKIEEVIKVLFARSADVKTGNGPKPGEGDGS